MTLTTTVIGGFSIIIIEKIFYLGSGQVSKIDKLQNSHIKAFQLDNIRIEREAKKFISLID